MAASFSSAGRRPCIRPTAMPGNTSCDRCSCIFSRGLHGLRFRFLDHRIHHVRLAALVDLLLAGSCIPARLRDRSTCLVTIGLRPGGISSITRHIQVAVQRQRQRARNGRRGHHQHVRMHALLHQLRTAASRRSDAARPRSPGPASRTPRPFRAARACRSPRAPGPRAISFLSCAFLAAGERSGEQHRHVTQLAATACLK